MQNYSGTRRIHCFYTWALGCLADHIVRHSKQDLLIWKFTCLISPIIVNSDARSQGVIIINEDGAFTTLSVKVKSIASYLSGNNIVNTTCCTYGKGVDVFGLQNTS